MKISKRVVAAAALAVLGSGAMVASVQAQDQAPQAANHGVQGRDFGHFRVGPGDAFVSTLLRAVHEESLTTPALALTQAQKQQIRTLTQTTFRDNAGKRTPPDVTVIGNPASSGFAGAVQTQQSAASSRVLAESSLASSIYQTVLTTQQQQALPAALQAIQAKAQKRRTAWQGRHPQSSNG